MNSYPPELLAQLAPVMFVAGLDPAVSVPPTSPVSPSPMSKPQDAFQVLAVRLREALLAQRKVAIWQPEKNKSFQVILVDKDVKFPPRKLVPPDDPQYSTAHSPLSPLTPPSPLHPDGLIAPIWIRKHTTLVPSVFVLFLRIFEYPSNVSKPPLDIDTDREREREAEERKRDLELAAEVAQRKKITNERGIKLTVVLMASRRMLDDPSLDSRLTFIRRQSGLDSRAALFVLSPVSPSELNEFVRSLQQALYEPALEYYTAHSKRVRRKRNRHSQSVSTYPTQATGGLNIARPLRSEGWTVRYEYKMACFAEFRGEDEVALKHYQDAYEMLMIMFGSTAILPPRTKRWAEAKVLADCINIKIIKLYLYNNEHALALSHHNAHIRVFGDFSRGWGIGEETFEFWSWVARQHRVLAELLEQGTQSTLVLPIHKPVNTSTNLTASQQTIRSTAGVEFDAVRSLGINPSHALQHPGFYYYVAARCTEMRRERFLAIAEAELSQKPIALSPGYTNEKKVEHLAIINELYTKAYELFKKHSPASAQGQGRLTLWIAYRIAQTYYEANKFDMAVRFFERIAKNYRREKWNAMLRPLLSTWYACAQQLGDVELSIRLLVEMLGHDVVDSEDPSSLEEDLLAVLKSTVPSSPDQTLVVDLAEAQPIFDSDVIFWSHEVKVDEEAPFQFTLSAPSNTILSSIPFSRITFNFSGGVPPIAVDHEPSDMGGEVKVVRLGHISSSGSTQPTVKANLRWQPGTTTVFSGTLSSSEPSELKIKTVVLTIEENGWKIDVPIELHGKRSSANRIAKWLSSVNPLHFIPVYQENYHSTLVKHREHYLKMAFHHLAPAYLDEDYPICIELTNTDTRDLDVIINVLLQPTEIDEAVNWIVVDEERSSSLIKGIHVGVLAPGVSVTKTLHLFSTGAAGDRMVDISVQTRTVSRKLEGIQEEDNGKNDEQQHHAHDMMEHLKMFTIPTVEPIQVTHDVSYRRSLKSWSGPADLQTFEESFWDDRKGGEALINVLMSCVGPWSLNIESVEFERADNVHATVIDSSTNVNEGGVLEFPAEYLAGDEFSTSCRVSLALDDEQDVSQNPIEGPGRYAVIWRRVLQNGELGPKTVSRFPLPSLRPPTDELMALLDVPPKATLHVPISLTLTVRNCHPTRSANLTLHLEPDSMDSFIVSGLRNGRMPVLLPGSEESMVWRMIPIECGYVKIPRIKVIDRRKAIPVSQSSGEPGAAAEASTGDLVKVVDVRRDRRYATSARSDSESAGAEEMEGYGTILVLP
ncbi:Gryzun, putative trafficking through golgi-domain-containing protein [Gymnopilus junonius]|uniref:Gryzun, putative trafficking through golgi-domain-containing protein n=1 Tax=Gymnopilus junonius TaxID=109634 RepID=A0A9P5P1F6_GYMJU|nr:Gryzun, putative trafficking through golgi-domain-containing protein [Gymnopilus junonius]